MLHYGWRKIAQTSQGNAVLQAIVAVPLPSLRKAQSMRAKFQHLGNREFDTHAPFGYEEMYLMRQTSL
jgi:hypothetical protein